MEEPKKIFKEMLTKIINAKPAIVDSNLSEEKNKQNFKQFINRSLMSINDALKSLSGKDINLKERSTS